MRLCSRRSRKPATTKVMPRMIAKTETIARTANMPDAGQMSRNHAERHPQDARQHDGPFTLDLLAVGDGAHELEGSPQDRPPGEQVEKCNRGEPWPEERHQPRENAERAADADEPTSVRTEAHQRSQRQETIGERVDAKDEDQGSDADSGSSAKSRPNATTKRPRKTRVHHRRVACSSSM